MSYQLPRSVRLRDGSSVTFKLLEPPDRSALKRFLEQLPAAERFYLRESVLSGDLTNGWLTHLDYLRVLPVLAVDDTGDVVGNATLHRESSGSRSHVGEARLVVTPDWRNRGLGTELVMQLLDEAQREGLEELVVELVAHEEEPAARALERINFHQVARLPGFARTERNEPRDILVYATEVSPILPAY